MDTLADTSTKSTTSFDESVKIIFNRDEESNPYQISDVSMNGIDNTTDMFWFLTKLLKSGLKHLFSKPNGDIDLDSLRGEDFALVNQCMHKIGVNVELQMIASDSNQDHLKLEKYFDNTENLDMNVAMSYAVVNNDYDKLQNHILFLFTKTKRFVIGYTLIESNS